MLSSIYFPLFLVLVSPTKEYSIFYLAADLQSPEMFKPRTPLSATARRAGWQGGYVSYTNSCGSLRQVNLDGDVASLARIGNCQLAVQLKSGE